jgi:hypothetical protein
MRCQANEILHHARSAGRDTNRLLRKLPGVRSISMIDDLEPGMSFTFRNEVCQTALMRNELCRTLALDVSRSLTNELNVSSTTCTTGIELLIAAARIKLNLSFE